MRRRHVQLQHLDEPCQAGRLTFWQVEHEPGESGGVDDRMLERALEAAAHQPGVKRVMAVLDQHRALSKAEKGTPCVAKLGRANQHRPVDVMAAVGVWIDRSLAVHQRVEERQWPVEPETFRSNLQNQERRVACRLDVKRNELRVVQPRLGFDVRRVDGDLIPRHGLRRSPRFEVDGLGSHRACASARRAQPISSIVNPRSKRTATP
jgi:hypothetical protein